MSETNDGGTVPNVRTGAGANSEELEGDTISCRYTICKADFAPLAQWRLIRGPFRFCYSAERWARSILLSAVVILSLHEVVVGLVPAKFDSALLVASILIGISVGCWCYAHFPSYVTNRTMRRHSRYPSMAACGANQLTISEDGLLVENTRWSGLIKWHTTGQLVETETHLLILYGALKFGVILVPTSSLSDVSREELASAIAPRIGTQARPRRRRLNIPPQL